ncbi:MAG: hypothetical protein ACK502_03470 [Alphaproteobacteria bacterium]
MLTSIRYILLTAFRDKLFIGVLIGVVCAAAISATLGSTAFLEEQQMTLTYAAGSARLILAVGLIVFVCFHIRSAFDSKEIDVMLSRPISRSNLVVAYWLGFSVVALLLVVPVVGVIAALGLLNMEGYMGWAISLLLEASLVVALALFSAFTLKSAVTSVLACMGFYVLSRMMAFFVIAADAPSMGQMPYLILKYVLKAISSIVPRLDFFAKTEWLVYGFTVPQEWYWFVLQAAIFIPLLLIAAILDFKRKQF